MTINSGIYSTYLVGYIAIDGYYSNTIDQFLVSNINNLKNTKNKINIYPNPTSNIINFDLDLSIKDYDLYIYNMKGQKVKSINQSNNGNNAIDISKLKAGTYLIQINKYSQIVQKTN